MTAIVIAMLVIVGVAAVVVVYVAYPHRGEELPVAPKLGDAISKAVDSLPTVAPADADEVPVDDLAAPGDTGPPAEPTSPPPGKHAADRS